LFARTRDAASLGALPLPLSFPLSDWFSGICRGARSVLGVMLFAALSAIASGAGTDFAAAQKKWQHYQSPHFELYSRNSDGSSRELLRNLELLHALFFSTFRFAERRPAEVTVYYFQSDRELAAYKSAHYSKDRELAAYYKASPDRSIIALSAEYDLESTQHTIFHEYIHHLFRVTGEEPPVWYNEGMAELFSTLEIGSNGLILGKPLPGHVALVAREDLLPLATLFAVDYQSSIYTQGQHTGLFYAESWALLHYSLFGKAGPLQARLDDFLRFAAAQRWKTGGSEELRAAFQQKVGIDYPAMEELLERYVRTGRYATRKVAPPKIASPESYPQRAVSHEEMRERLAELALRVNRDPRGKLVLLQALEKNPANIRALESLGADALIDGDEVTFRERWERAIAAGSRNPALYHELALFEGRRWFGEFDYYFRLPEQKTEELRKLLLRSIEGAPDQVVAYELLAWVEASAPAPKPAHVNLVQQHFPVLKEQQRTLLALALVRARLGDKETALQLLADLDRMVEPESSLSWQVRFVQRRLQTKPEGEEKTEKTVETSASMTFRLVKPSESNR
jgi:hypothetical protein